MNLTALQVAQPLPRPASTSSPLLARFDDFDRRLTPETAKDVMPELIRFLNRLRAELGPALWAQACAVAQSHPLAEKLRADPFTRRSCAQPRGYAGDAVMIDHVYRGLPEGEPVSALGAAIFAVTAGRSPSAVAVRERRDWCAGWVNEAAERKGRAARVASVACGHLREADLSFPVASGQLAEFVALDQDAESLAVVRARHLPSVRTVEGGVRQLIRGAPLLTGGFDLVYSAGLYDYLERRATIALTEKLFDALAPGGRLYVANFVPDFATAGYMEAFMRWTLICRDEAQMQGLVGERVAAQLERSWTFHATNGSVVYLGLEKKKA